MEQSLALRDIHLPEAISWWPPAMGWWLLLVLIPLLVFGAWWLYKRLTRNTTVKSAKRLLATIKEEPNTDDLQKLQQLSTWLRRVSISLAPRQKSAGLTGRAWLTYLDNGVDGSPFSEGIGQCLAEVQFRQSAPDELDINGLITLCETWLKGQKP
ncbi:MAG: DUF4381 domain-containing protein [Pseudomonadota bacterium]|nr:DUF4381 domain-containing protein [Pseudomonadota bacterium]MDO7667151.1 DUF4381 domain-containing protein [Pseudomonadota bacterium]MDO7710137.1 DUF4381 domain-containing protein [Pseudomonadota bacterium]